MTATPAPHHVPTSNHATTQPRPLSVAYSPCPNDTFVFDAWANGRLEGVAPIVVTYADVDVTNTRAEQGEYDVVKVSYAALPWLLKEYQLLPCGGALGRGCGPLILTRGQDRDRVGTGGHPLDGARIAVPGQRTTAYLLMRLWAADAHPAAIDVVPFAEIMPAVQAGRYDAGLVIHEARFTYPSYGLNALVDLGEWWEADTGLPIPLGAILARRSLDADALSRTIRASVDQAWARPQDSAAYIAEHADEMDPQVQRQHIALYVNEFTRDLGEDGYAAIEALLGRAHDAGLVPDCPPLR